VVAYWRVEVQFKLQAKELSRNIPHAQSGREK